MLSCTKIWMTNIENIAIKWEPRVFTLYQNELQSFKNVRGNHTFRFAGRRQECREVGTGQLWTWCSAATGRYSEVWQIHLSQIHAQLTNSHNTWSVNTHTQLETSDRNLTKRNASQRTGQKPSRACHTVHFANRLPRWRLVTTKNYRPDVTALG